MKFRVMSWRGAPDITDSIRTDSIRTDSIRTDSIRTDTIRGVRS
jgi:hypothetical protein